MSKGNATAFDAITKDKPTLAGFLRSLPYYCAYAGIDIENVLEVKHEYNKNRPYRHGGKKC